MENFLMWFAIFGVIGGVIGGVLDAFSKIRRLSRYAESIEGDLISSKEHMLDLRNELYSANERISKLEKTLDRLGLRDPYED